MICFYSDLVLPSFLILRRLRADMDESDVILKLTAIDEFAAHIFTAPHNIDFYHPPSFAYSRESTPSCNGDAEGLDLYHSSFLTLSFDRKPKNPARGFTFGENRKKCDVYLPKRSISSIHFSITFSSDGRLVLEDTSKHGLWVTINGQRNVRPRHHFTWILKTGEDIKIDFGDDHTPQIGLHVPRYEAIPGFQEKLARYLDESRKASPAFELLDLSSRVSTAQPSRSLSPRRQPFYVEKRRLGEGEFGAVYEARDVSTDATYAIKKFKDSMGKQSVVKEIETMRNLPPHVGIAPEPYIFVLRVSRKTLFISSTTRLRTPNLLSWNIYLSVVCSTRISAHG